MTDSKWWISTDPIGKPGSPKVAGPFSTMEDAITARTWMEKTTGNFSIFEEKPAPKVDLPTEPTLGWLSYREQYNEIGYWSAPGVDHEFVRRNGVVTHLALSEVTAFTPATAVPTAALDELREGAHFGKLRLLVDAVETFLAAIDKAGEPNA